MDSTLPDAFKASQPGSTAGQTFGGENIGSSVPGPFVKVDGMVKLLHLRTMARDMMDTAWIDSSPERQADVFASRAAKV